MYDIYMYDIYMYDIYMYDIYMYDYRIKITAFQVLMILQFFTSVL